MTEQTQTQKYWTQKYWPATSEDEHAKRVGRAKEYLKCHQVWFPGDLDDLSLYDLEYLVYETRRFGG